MADDDEEDDKLAAEAAELDGYFSDAPLDPQPNYPDLDTSMDRAIIVTNLPVVPEAKVEKLTKVVTKLVSRIGTLVANNNSSGDDDDFSGLYMPFDEAKQATCGFCMVEFETREQATNALQVLQDYKFDKNHALKVAPFARALELEQSATDEFPQPDIPPFVEQPNTTKWLEDANQRDQFVTRHGKETHVYWYDCKNDPVIDYDGARETQAGVQWCEYYCHWSPSGSYLATLVPARGVIFWSGETYEKSGRFIAPQVKHVLFSPQENYLLTNNERHDDPAAIKVYHIPTGKLLRNFPLYPDGISKEDEPPPPFLWSHDDAYLARRGKGLISIYETPGMRLLSQRSLAAPGVAEFQWSPRSNILAYWAPEADNSPAHVDLLAIPSRKKMRQKNLFHVTRCSMVWHPQGDYLAVKVTRHTKSKKTMYNNIELFRLRDPNGVNLPNVPVEMLDIKDAVMALTWEPKGSRFCLIHAENPTAPKVNVSFYDMIKTELQQATTVVGQKAKKAQTQRVPELNKVETLAGRQCNYLSWSPAGSTIIMASLGESASGTLEFYDVDSKSLVIKEHYRANQVLWDPAGRAVATIVSQPIEGGHFKFAMDNGYILWSFQGKQLFQQSFETFYQFQWRPRESLLNKQEIEKVRRNLKRYEKQFDKADKRRQRALYLEETKGKRQERQQYRDLLAHNRQIRQQQRDLYIQLNGGVDPDDDANYVTRELTVETILSSKDEIVM